jgi:hypothetical protein
MEREFKRFVCLAVVFMAAILLLDADGLVPQLLLGSATAAFAWIFCRRLNVAPAAVICCVIVATAGEIVLSLGWGLYSYRHAVIPLYVPPGHGLFYALAVASSRQQFFRTHERIIKTGVVAMGTIVALISLALYADTWGLLWWIGAVALLLTSRNQLMLSACFVYTILLEWAGTANGNWQWVAGVPFVGLTSANPPSGVGILYILLDLIVVAIASRFLTTESAGPAPGQPAGTPAFL